MKCKEVMNALEELSPLKYALDWDNVGLLIGREEKTVQKIMIALDASDTVIEQAILAKVDMLITHHPLIFSSMKRITEDGFIGSRLLKLIGHDISYYAMHTNFDTMGMAEAAADKLQLKNRQVLDPIYIQTLYKIAVYVPSTHADKVREAIISAGAGHIGDYSHCTFNQEGVGTYMPLEGTKPFIGHENELAKTPETKIETIVEEEKLHQVIQEMKKVHPYEEVAYDIYELKNKGQIEGIGRTGDLQKHMTLEECARFVKKRFGLDYVSVVGDLAKPIKKVSISTGSGKSLVQYALKQKADVLVTGDIDHHTAIDAVARGLSIIDAGHFGTERFMASYVKDYLDSFFIRGEKEENIKKQSKNTLYKDENNGYNFDFNKDDNHIEDNKKEDNNKEDNKQHSHIEILIADETCPFRIII